MGFKSVSGKHHVAYIERATSGCAYVEIYPRKGKYDIDFSKQLENYETLSKGAAASARRSLKKLDDAVDVSLTEIANVAAA